MRNTCVLTIVAIAAVTSSSYATSQCIVTNGGFDTDLIGWTYDSAGIGTAEFNNPLGLPIVGPTAGLFNPGPSPDGDPVMLKNLVSTPGMSGSNWVYQELFTVVGTQYKVDGNYAGGIGGLPAGTTGSWEVVIYPGAYDAVRTAGTADSIAMTTISNPLGGQFGWTPVVGSFTATDPTYTIALKWSVSAPNIGASLMGAYFDGFCIVPKPIPEPATLALFGLAIPILRRQRKLV